MRSIEDWFGVYERDHRDRRNLAIHWICVPVALWAVIALLWLIPVPHGYAQDGAWAALAMFGAYFFYHRLSRNLGWAMAGVFIVLALVTAGSYAWLGSSGLLRLAMILIVAALAGQAIGYRLENRRPLFLRDPRYLLIGPAWLMSRLMRRVGIDH